MNSYFIEKTNITPDAAFNGRARYVMMLQKDVTITGEVRYLYLHRVMKIGVNKSSNLGDFHFIEFDKLARLIMPMHTMIAEVSIPERATVFRYEASGVYATNRIELLKIIILSDLSHWDNKDFCVNAVTVNGCAFKYCRVSSAEVCKLVLKQQPYFIAGMEQTKELCIEAVRSDGLALRNIRKQTNEIRLEAVKRTGLALMFSDVQNDRLCRAAVSQYGDALQLVKKPTRSIKIAAVRRTPDALRFVKKQSVHLCKLAVRQFGHALRWVRRQTIDICMIAVTQNGTSLRFVDEDLKTYGICRAAVTKNWEALEFVPVKFLTSKMITIATNQNPEAMKFVKLRRSPRFV